MRAWLLPALLLLPGAPQDKGPRKLEFSLPPGRVAEYAVLDRAGKPDPERSLLVFGSELTPSGNRFLPERYEELPLALAFLLPPEPFKGGVAWPVELPFFLEAQDAAGGFLAAAAGGGSLRPVLLRGRLSARPLPRKGEEELFAIDGAFTFLEIRRTLVNNQVRFTPSTNDLGTLVTSVQFSPSRGLPLRAGWQLKVKGQEREAGRLADRKFDLHVQVLLREDRDLDPAAVRVQAAEASARAVARLKALQLPDGSWLPGRQPPPRAEALPTTALAVRGLLAAGVPGTDPAITAASRLLRSPAPPETPTLALQILALAAKGPDAPEAAHLLRLGDELLRRRDPRSGGWTAGGRGDAPSLPVTSVALEALAVCPGVQVPPETWTASLALVASLAADEDDDLDLDLQLKDGAPFSPDPKRVRPATWPSRIGTDAMDLPADRKRGTALTVLAAMRAAEACASRLPRDGPARRTLDEVRRRGLAALQRRWTLRSVPPAEGPWSSQRLPYLGGLAGTLGVLGVERVAGSDWRTEGALLLLREQAVDGSWGGGESAAGTAQALAFLAALN
jgi:hypothetical protein